MKITRGTLSTTHTDHLTAAARLKSLPQSASLSAEAAIERPRAARLGGG